MSVQRGAIKGFIRKNGKIIPLHAAVGAAKGAAFAASSYETARALRHKKTFWEKLRPSIKVDRKWDAAGIGLSLASGALGAATFGFGTKGFLAGQAATYAIDAASVGAAGAAVQGKGRIKERAKTFATIEARNIVLGNAVFYGGILAQKASRERVVKVVTKGIKFLRLGKKAMGAV
jgi:hypothetical protein